MDPLPLTKSCDPADFDRLVPELTVVDARFTAAATQHPMRRWEYALALHAWNRWPRPSPGPHAGTAWYALDVGGAGSPFSLMLPPTVRCEVVDPALNCGIESALIAPGTQDAVFCISTLEHVEVPLPVLRAIHRALAPGGLCVLTVDFTDTEGPDEFHFHWMRKRIYTPTSRAKLYRKCRELGFRLFGGHDWSPHGNFVFDYTFASLVLIKGEPGDPDV